MQAVIMAGGFGTRLHPLTCNIPKPMVPLNNVPIIEHVIRLLKGYGITDIVVLLYFQPEVITDYLGDGSRWGVTLQYLRPEMDLGTAGAVKYAEPLLKERFLVISGDLLTDFDLRKGIAFHNKAASKVTIFLTHVPNPLSYGLVITEHNGRIKQFLEKPSWGQVFSDLINTGIYIIEPDVLKFITPGVPFDFSNDLFPIIMKNGEPLFGYTARGYWRDIGNLEEYLQAHKDILNEVAKIPFPGTKRRNVWSGKGTKIHPTAKMEGKVVLGSRCMVGPGAFISNSCIGDNTVIEERATVTHSILWGNVSIGAGSRVNEDIIASGTHIEGDVYLQERVFIGENCSVGENSRIQANVKVWPEKIIERETTLSSSLVWGSRWERTLFFDAKVSGLVNTEMSPEFCARLGTAYGAFLGEGSRVLVSHDPSNGSRMINRSFIGGLLSMGISVDNARVIPVPVLRTGLRAGRYRGGIHIRQSPVDRRNADIIFFDSDGNDLSPGKTKAVEKMFFMENYKRLSFEHIGSIDYPGRIVENYRDYFLNAIDPDAFKKRRLKIVVDFSCGGSSTIFPSVLGALGCDVISLNAYLDPSRLSMTPKEIEDGLAQLSKIVRSLRADAGFMINQAGESITAVDEKGNIIDNQELLVMVTDLFLGLEYTKKIAVPVTATAVVDRVAEKYGVDVIRIMNSHRAMTEAGMQEDVRYVGGTRGGFIFAEHFFACDGMFATAKIVEMIAKAGTSVSSQAEKFRLPAYVLHTVACPWDRKGRVMRLLIEHTVKMNRMLVEGVKVFLPNGWVLVFPDQRSASFYVIAEAPSKKAAESLAKKWVAKVEQWKGTK